MDSKETEGNNSSFNEALLKMERIHKLQDYINFLRIDLLTKDPLSNQYNYEKFIFCLISLMNEVKDKGSPDEVKKAIKWRETILDLLEIRPAFTNKKSNGVGDSKIIKIYSDANWKVLRPALFNYEDFIRGIIEKYGFSTPNVESEAGWD
jgi:hypothetical protein